MKPLVSILILTYNRVAFSSQYIPLLVNRVGNIDFEVLIWDNGSEDGSFDWVASYGQADARVSEVVGYDKNIGMEAINHLAKKAKGKYILKVDDDIEVPNNFGKRLVCAYEEVNEDKLLFLGWDMKWGEKTFATRSGLKLYKPPKGKIINLANRSRVFINFDPSMWMINGVCRLCLREKFLEIGGHPKGIVYGVDKHISRRAAEHGYWTAYLSAHDLVMHRGLTDDPNYRKMKNKQLKKFGSPLDV
jgi:glycosyltransferase involved in cell wall biosynthesis